MVKDMTQQKNRVFVMMREIHPNLMLAIHLSESATHALQEHSEVPPMLQNVLVLMVKDMIFQEDHVFAMMREIRPNQILATHLLVFAIHAQLVQPEILVILPNVSAPLVKNTTMQEDHVFVTTK